MFGATCSGKLKAARLEPFNGSTRLGMDPDYNPGDGSWLLYENDGRHGAADCSTQRRPDELHGRLPSLAIGCPEPIVGDLDPIYCPPGRIDRGGGPAWRDGVFEEWNLHVPRDFECPRKHQRHAP